MKYTRLVCSLFAFVCVAAAQETPRQEFSLQYDYLRANSATNIPSFAANGGGGQYGWNFNKWLSGVADIYAAHNGNVFGQFTDPFSGVTYPGGKIDNTTVFYQFGPRVYVRHWSRVTPFFEMFLGGANASVSIPVALQTPLVIPTPLPRVVKNQLVNPTCTTVVGSAACNILSVTNLRAQTSQNVFAYNLGGGLDIALSHHMRFRPIEADLQYTRFQNLRSLQDKSQYNFRYSTGLVFTFGKID